jgi:hypothetical protein
MLIIQNFFGQVLVLVQQLLKIQISLVRCWIDDFKFNQFLLVMNAGQCYAGASYSNFIGLSGW